MKFPFRKVTSTAQDFLIERAGITFKGDVSAYKRNLVRLNGHISGPLALDCDRCAENFDTILDEEFTLILSDGIFHGNDEEYDVVEMLDSIIDIDAILESELQMHRSDYHICPSCA